MVKFIKLTGYIKLKYNLNFFSTLLIFSLILFNTLNAQYTLNDEKLIRTTYDREFDRTIIMEYLKSGDIQKQKAALLSISNSLDTSFVNDVLMIQNNELFTLKLFTLGELGASEKSSKFLMNQLLLKIHYPDSISRQIFIALGKCGSKDDLESVLKMSRAGIPLAIVQFNDRNIKSEKTKAFLINLFEKAETNEEYFDILFAIYRIGGYKEINDKLADLLYDPKINTDIKVYALGCLRRTKQLPENLSSLSGINVSSDWRVRCEIARIAQFYNFESESELEAFLLMITHKNPNIARQAANSIRNFKLKEEFLPSLESNITTLLGEKGIDKLIKGELLVSYFTLFNGKPSQLIDMAKRVPLRYFYEAIPLTDATPKVKLKYLLKREVFVKPINASSFCSVLLSLQDSLFCDSLYVETILKFMNSEIVSVVGQLAGGLDTIFIQSNSCRLEPLISEIVDKKINDYNLSESLPIIAELTTKIDSSFGFKILKKLYHSEIISVSNFAAQKLELAIRSGSKDLNLFNKIWENSFSYEGATIFTNVGNFTIKFLPEYAPISVGNFVYLAKQNYFNHVYFHRVVPNFVIQTGDTTGTGWSGPGYEIISENSPIPYKTGAVGMASAGRDTEGSQWFVMHNNFPHLNGNYSNFGEIVTERDQEVVDLVKPFDWIVRIELLKKIN